jgi:hypothetical protein
VSKRKSIETLALLISATIGFFCRDKYYVQTDEIMSNGTMLRLVTVISVTAPAEEAVHRLVPNAVAA